MTLEKYEKKNFDLVVEEREKIFIKNRFFFSFLSLTNPFEILFAILHEEKKNDETEEIALHIIVTLSIL
jgi:hypothetical protein